MKSKDEYFCYFLITIWLGVFCWCVIRITNTGLAKAEASSAPLMDDELLVRIGKLEMEAERQSLRIDAVSKNVAKLWNEKVQVKHDSTNKQ